MDFQQAAACLHQNGRTIVHPPEFSDEARRAFAQLASLLGMGRDKDGRSLLARMQASCLKAVAGLFGVDAGKTGGEWPMAADHASESGVGEGLGRARGGR